MFHIVGNAHLDPAWMWRMDEGLEAFAATCRSALDRIAEFPDFIFTCSSAAHYAYVEATDAGLFLRIQQAVREGRWCIAGGWWVEPDCNLPSGESFVRQALLGQRYFLRCFGRMASTGYNVDSFGHHANLPRLLRGAGLTSYVFMRPQEEEHPLTSPLFFWNAPGGNGVMAYRLPLHYSDFQHTISEKVELLPRQPFFSEDRDWMLFFGVGNHGGGPAVEQLREIEQVRQGRNDLRLSSPDAFFAGVNSGGLPVMSGEFQRHAIGCYSAHSEIKQLNRRAEHALGVAEVVRALAHLVVPHEESSGQDADRQQSNFERAWKNVCFNQFHDLLGGVAIEEACEDAITMYREAIAIAERSIRLDTQRIASRVDTSAFIENIIVFNPSGFDREECIAFELWHPQASERGELLHSVTLVDGDGGMIDCQHIAPSGKIGTDRVGWTASVRAPAMGWAAFGVLRNRDAVETAPGHSDGQDGAVGSPLISASQQKMWHTGTGIGMLFDENGAAAVHPLLARFTPPIVLRDESDTWAHGRTEFEEYLGPFEIQSVEVVEDGPALSRVRIHTGMGGDRAEYECSIDGNGHWIDQCIHIEWHGEHTLLKLRYLHGCRSPIVRYEIPYASLERPVRSGEWPGQTWVDVSEADGTHGMAVITDSKYSYSVDDKYIYIIAARSPLYAHHVPPHAPYPGERLRYLDRGVQEFRVRIVPHEGTWRGADLARRSEGLHRPLIVRPQSRHPGMLPVVFSGLRMIGEGVVVGAVKLAEEHGTSGGMVLRAVETHGATTEATFEINGISWSAVFSPFQLRTFLLRDGRIVETDLLERPL